MSEKIVKITNGKILNYKISASGYKTIYGSQVISSDTTINKEMIAENDPNGVYSLGDRIGGIASFVCYFNSTNPETNVDQKYAVFVLDAKYRNNNLQWAVSNSVVLPLYTTSNVLTSTDSATYNTSTVLNNNTPSNYPAFNFARNAATLAELNIQSQLPNAYELKQIFDNRVFLDTVDPTLTDYSSLSLTSWIGGTENRCWSSNQIENYRACVVTNDGSVSSNWSGFEADLGGVIPVLEIPVE